MSSRIVGFELQMKERGKWVRMQGSRRKNLESITKLQDAYTRILGGEFRIVRIIESWEIIK